MKIEDATGSLIGFFEGYFDWMFDVLAASRSGPPAVGAGSASSEEVTKHASQIIAVKMESLPTTLVETPKTSPLPSLLGKLVGVLPLIAVLVVFLPIFLIGEDLVSLIYFLEFGFRGLVAGINVGMVLSGQASISPLYILFAGVPFDP